VERAVDDAAVGKADELDAPEPERLFRQPHHAAPDEGSGRFAGLVGRVHPGVDGIGHGRAQKHGIVVAGGHDAERREQGTAASPLAVVQ